ncbi:hypothetical protein GCM10025869_31510 [Homoserinibacter gongjuensis]|uniref:Uncharacterized protein n=1 Tax=Homoserinibacter gongjuensis TaxID=1162968 RepID=A0ABQ6JWE3_9MICO|nr:hypothetical protein GCM10025869_31510 [Homoserinibacter gongjuensis]
MGCLGEGRGVAEAGQIGADHADAVELRDDGLQPVVVAAVAVGEHENVAGVLRAEIPEPGAGSEDRELALTHRNPGERGGVRSRDGHPSDSRLASSAQGDRLDV